DTSNSGGAWTGRVVRGAGEVDSATRMARLVIRVPDPYGRLAGGSPASSPELRIGAFVRLEIEGRPILQAIRLARTSLQPDGTVLVADSDDRLRSRPVEVLRREDDWVFLGGGLAEGERVILTPLETVVEGMRLQILEAAGGE
ncbi:MAG TPA: hypothetical protein VGC54_08845, partial [Planctomycetota bacterium]